VVVVLLLVCGLSLITLEGIELFRRTAALQPGIGWTLAGAGLVLLLLLTWTVIASIVEYTRVRKRLLSQPIDVLALQHDAGVDWTSLRSVRMQLEKELAHPGIDLAPADLAELRAVQAELNTWPTDNTRQWLLRYDGDLLAVIDRAVAERIRKEAVNIAILTSLSPRGGVDSLLVIWRQFRLIRTIAVLYGWRPGFWGTLLLIRSVLTNAALAAGLDEVGDLAVEMLGSGISVYAGGLISEAIGNAALSLRLARRAVDACRPLQNRKAPPYRVTLLQIALEVRHLRRGHERDSTDNQAQSAGPSEAS
jgi:putative membrane protein